VTKVFIQELVEKGQVVGLRGGEVREVVLTSPSPVDVPIIGRLLCAETQCLQTETFGRLLCRETVVGLETQKVIATTTGRTGIQRGRSPLGVSWTPRVTSLGSYAL